jgi:ribonuclease VapC
MIVIDSTAIIAILNDEPERRVFNEAIEQADGCLISTASFVEASISIDNQPGYDGLRDFDLFIVSAGIELVPVEADQAHIARQS